MGIIIITNLDFSNIVQTIPFTDRRRDSCTVQHYCRHGTIRMKQQTWYNNI